METRYVTTHLEDWVTNMYKRLNITKPKEINPVIIARYFSIYIKQHHYPSRYDVNGRFRAITLDSRSTPKEKYEQFFHELCHILRHCGHQTMLPNAFRELQEYDANNFMMYAAVPHHMLHFIDFDKPTPLLLKEMSDMFRVTESLCKKRLERIQNRILQHSFSMVSDSSTDYEF